MRPLAMVGKPTGATTEVPWFWSDQYDLKLQIAGPCRSRAIRSCPRGDPALRKFAVFHLARTGAVAAVEAVNAAAEYLVGRQA